MAATMTKALLVEPLAVAPLDALCGDRPWCLLPVANRPLVVYTLVALAEAGFKDVELRVRGRISEVRKALGSGERWGLSLTIVDAGTMTWSAVIRESEVNPASASQLYMLLDAVPGAHSLKNWLAQVSESQSAPVDRDGHVLAMHRGGARSMFATRAESTGCLPDMLRISDARSYLHASMMCVDALAETHYLERRYGLGIYLGHDTGSHPTVEFNEPCLVGVRTSLREHARIGPRAIIGPDVFVEADAELVDCVVMPGTYIGNHLALHGKIIDGTTLIDIESGTVSSLDDPALLARIGLGTDEDGWFRTLMRKLSLLPQRTEDGLTPTAPGLNLVADAEPAGDRVVDAAQDAQAAVSHDAVSLIPLPKGMPTESATSAATRQADSTTAAAVAAVADEPAVPTMNRA